MAREGTRGASARKKSPKKAEEATDAAANNKIKGNTNDAVKEPGGEQPQQTHHHPLARVVEGMNRRSLLTGLYGPTGSRIRHAVANGALSMPKEALDIMANFETNDAKEKEGDKKSQATKNKKRKADQLPGLDSVDRPSMDKSLRKIIVTDIFLKAFPNTADPTQPPSMRTVAVNRGVDVNYSDAERIRGGGDEEGAVEKTDQKVEVPTSQSAASDNPIGGSSGSGEMVTSSASHAPASQSSAAPAPPSTGDVSTPKTSESAGPVANPTQPSATTKTTSSDAATPAQATVQPAALAPAQVSNPASTVSTQSLAAPKSDAPASEGASKPEASTTTTDQPAQTQTQPAAGATSSTPNPLAAAPVPTSAANSMSAIQPTSNAPTAPSSAPTAAIPTATVATPAAPSGPTSAPSTAASTATAAAPATTSAPTSTPTTAASPAPATATTPALAATPAPASAPTTASAPIPSAASTRRASALVPLEPAKEKVIPLVKKTPPHWEQHIPSANDENLTDPEAKAPKPDWYIPTKASNLERTLLPEWFDDSASHRTEETYLKARETMIHISDQLGNRFVTSTLARRSLPGDVGSLHRLHNFLTSYLWMNEEGRNDSAPTAPSLQQPPQLTRTVWTEKRLGDLIQAVVEVSQQSKKQKTDVDDPMDIDTVEQAGVDDTFVPINWDAIAERVGASPVECEREFLALDDSMLGGSASETERPITPDTMASDPARDGSKFPKDCLAQEDFLRSLIEETSPKALKAVTEAAMRATGQDLPAAQRAARFGLVACQAVKAAKAHEETVSRLLSEVVDQRMQKLECRMALMDDLEGMLEAERVALELERRDLYTTRCRDWFGGS